MNSSPPLKLGNVTLQQASGSSFITLPVVITIEVISRRYQIYIACGALTN